MIYTNVGPCQGSVLHSFIKHTDDIRYIQAVMPVLLAESVAHRRSQSMLNIPLGLPNVTLLTEILSEANDDMELLRLGQDFAFKTAYDEAVSSIVASYNLQSQAVDAFRNSQDYSATVAKFTGELREVVASYIVRQPLPELSKEVLANSGRSTASIQATMTNLIIVGVFLNSMSESSSTGSDWLAAPSGSNNFEQFLTSFHMFRNLTAPGLANTNQFDIKALLSFSELSHGGTKGHRFFFLHAIKTVLSNNTLPLRASDLTDIMLGTKVDNMKRSGIYTTVGPHKNELVASTLRSFGAEHFHIQAKEDVPYPTFYEYWCVLEQIVGGNKWHKIIEKTTAFLTASEGNKAQIESELVVWLTSSGTIDHVNITAFCTLVKHIEFLRSDFALSLLDVDAINRLPKLSVGLTFSQARAQNIVSLFEKSAGATILREMYPLAHVCYVLKEALQHVPHVQIQYATDPFLGNYLSTESPDYLPLIYAPLTANRAIHIDDLNEYEFWKKQNHLKVRLYSMNHKLSELARVKETDPEVPRADELLRLSAFMKTYSSNSVKLDVGFFGSPTDALNIDETLVAQAQNNTKLISLNDSKGILPKDDLSDVSMFFAVGDLDIVKYLVSSRHPGGAIFVENFLRSGDDLGISLSGQKIGIYKKPAIRTLNSVNQLAHTYEYFGKILPLALACELGLQYKLIYESNDMALIQAHTTVTIENLSAELRNLRLLLTVTYGPVIIRGVIERDPVMSALTKDLVYDVDGGLDLTKVRWSDAATKFFSNARRADNTLYGMDSTSLVVLDHDISLPQMQMMYISPAALGVYPLIVTRSTNFFDPDLFEEWIDRGNGQAGVFSRIDSSLAGSGGPGRITPSNVGSSLKNTLLRDVLKGMVGHQDRLLPYVDIIKVSAPSFVRLRSAITTYRLMPHASASTKPVSLEPVAEPILKIDPDPIVEDVNPK